MDNSTVFQDDYSYNKEKMKLRIKKLDINARLPTRESNRAAGYDLYANENIHINPDQRCLVSTGIAIQIPYGYYGRIAPRSGLAVRNGINVGAGVIDSNYTGHVKILLFNHGETFLDIKDGDRIAQLIIEKIGHFEIEEVDELDQTSRGENGFGSTGR